MTAFRSVRLIGVTFPPVLFMILILLVIPAVESAVAQEHQRAEIDSLIQNAYELKDGEEESTAMEIYEKVLEMEPDNYEALWNLSLLNSVRGHRQEDESERMEYYQNAKELGEECLEHHPEKSRSHFAYAVAIGRIADISSPRDRIEASKEIRDHAERAIELDPEFSGSWHLLGVWHMNAANLSRAERWAANLLFGGAPEGASNEKAEESLKRAVEMDPENILYNLDLARFYKITDRRDDAIEILEYTIELNPQIKDDPRYLEEAREMLNELR